MERITLERANSKQGGRMRDLARVGAVGNASFASCCVWILVRAALCILRACLLRPDSRVFYSTTEPPKCDAKIAITHTYPMVGTHRSHQHPPPSFPAMAFSPARRSNTLGRAIPPARSSAPRGSWHPDATCDIMYCTCYGRATVLASRFRWIRIRGETGTWRWT